MARTRQPKNDTAQGAETKTTTKPEPPAEVAQAAAETVKQAKDTPVIIRQAAEAQSFPLADEGKTNFKAEDNRIERLDDVRDPEIDIPQNVTNIGEKAAALAFLEEKVTIVISESSEKNPEKFIFCAVNGVGPGPGGTPWLPRGVEIKVARKYVEVLARSRPVHVRSQERYDPGSGERVIDQVKTSSLRYPFTVVEDPNPRGRAWLASLLGHRS